MESQFDVGDLVWAKLHGYPWWPGIIYDEALTNTQVQQAKVEGFMLVSFFGDNSYKWLDPKNLLHFESNFSICSNRSSLRLFVQAVNEAVYEVNHRAALGLTCPCQFFSSYRPAHVKGFLEVDIAGYQSGGIYTTQQIKGFKQEFQPVKTLSFVQLLALDSTNVHRDFNLSKEVARVLAFRKAKYEEVDEPYFEAFGVDPKRRGNPIVISNDDETTLVQVTTDHPSNAESKAQKKPTVKHQNEKKTCIATQKVKPNATKTEHTVKSNPHHDSNSKSSQDHFLQKTRQAKVEVKKNLDKKVKSSTANTKCDDMKFVEKLKSSDTSMSSKTQSSHKNSLPLKKRRTTVSVTDSPKMSLALSSQKKIKKEEKSSIVIKAPQEGPKMILSMKFPTDSSLPSVSELKAKFVIFGPRDITGVGVNYLKSRCQVVFMNKSDAEKAYNHAVKFKNMFGQTNVSYRLYPVFSKPELPEIPVAPPVSSRMASVCQRELPYQESYGKNREQADQTCVQVNQGSVDISEKMLYLLNECYRIVREYKQCR